MWNEWVWPSFFRVSFALIHLPRTRLHSTVQHFVSGKQWPLLGLSEKEPVPKNIPTYVIAVVVDDECPGEMPANLFNFFATIVFVQPL